MKPPLSRYIALAQRRTMALMSRRGPLLEKKDRADTALALRDQDRTERALAHGEANRGVRDGSAPCMSYSDVGTVRGITTSDTPMLAMEFVHARRLVV